ncbi:MAG: Asp-tRNA(Asn)/Glu-tRNA(Gln) amidotransferase subunit GatC [Patescibacteria group bacterium]
MITREEIEKLATLSRLKLDASEVEKYRTEIDSILDYIEQIKEASTSLDEKDISTGPLKNVFRDDVNSHESGAHTDVLVAEFPKKSGNYLKVKNIL